jgi:hypothetical protein
VKPARDGEIYLAFRGLDVPAFTADAEVRRVHAAALDDARPLPEVRQYVAAAANLDRLSRAARAARANLSFAEARLDVLVAEDTDDDLPQRTILAKKNIARLKAEVASAAELEGSAAAIARARWQAARDALGRQHNAAAVKASQAAMARVNELAGVIAEKCKDELTEMARAQATWDGLGVVVSQSLSDQRCAALLSALKAEAARASAAPRAEAPAPATATATA